MGPFSIETVSCNAFLETFRGDTAHFPNTAKISRFKSSLTQFRKSEVSPPSQTFNLSLPLLFLQHRNTCNDKRHPYTQYPLHYDNSIKMRFLAPALLSLVSLATAHNIHIGGHTKECFFETLHKDDKMTVTFQVGDREFGGAGGLDIDFWVC